MWPVLKSFGEERICHSENDSRSEINKVYLQFYTEQCKEGEEGAENKIKWRERVAMSVAHQRSPYLHVSGQNCFLDDCFNLDQFISQFCSARFVIG